MTAPDLIAAASAVATLIAAATPGIVALARIYRQGDTVRRLELSHPERGKRIGDVATELAVLQGRVEELSRLVHDSRGVPR